MDLPHLIAASLPLRRWMIVLMVGANLLQVSITFTDSFSGVKSPSNGLTAFSTGAFTIRSIC